MKKIFLSMLALGLTIASCNKDDNSGTTTTNLKLNLTGLQDLGATHNYEGWLIVNGAPISTGTFKVDAAGALSATSFSVETTNLTTATKFVLTVEPNPDTDPAPSEQKLLAGDFSGNTANVSTSTAPAIGDFSASKGSFFLRTPTDETSGNNGNDENGVWFGVPGAPPTPDFTLPTLPAGWIYEGWVVVDGVGPLSTGTFTAFNTADNSGTFSGTNPGPPIPGEDFFNNAPAGFTFPLDVRNRKVVVSIEPVPDNSPAPFLLKPLVGTAGTATAPTTYQFGYNAASFPTGSVTR